MGVLDVAFIPISNNCVLTVPEAPFTSAVVPLDTLVELRLPGVDVDGDDLRLRITSVPAVGKLYHLSEVYSLHG